MEYIDLNKKIPHINGDTWGGMTVKFDYQLTGYTAISRFKNNSVGSIDFSFNTDDNTLLIANDTITYVPRIINAKHGVYDFDLQITSPSGVVQTVFFGKFYIKKDISQ